jgi:hypothetical protein
MLLLVTLEKTDASSESIELFFATHLEGPMAGHIHPLHLGDLVSAHGGGGSGWSWRDTAGTEQELRARLGFQGLGNLA